mgnify:CR=1 FL=1
MDYRILYKGKSFVSLLNFLEREKISAYNIKTSDDCTEFDVSSKDYKRLKQKNKIFKLEIKRVGGIKNIAQTFLKRIGLIAGIVVVIVFSVFTSRVSLRLQLSGNSKIDEITILSALKNYGYVLGKSTTFNKDEMEKYLLDNVEGLSLVSVSKKGNVLLINVVEKTTQDETGQPFYAPYNMIIKDVKLISGTLLVKKDDIVKKGDIIVDNYVIGADGERITIPAEAEITAEVYFCGSVSVNKVSTILEKTGKKYTKNSISFFKPDTPLYDNKYAHFDINISHSPIFNNMFLPIYVNKVVIYEMSEKEIIFDYDNDKDKYFQQSLKNAYDNVPSGVIINNEISQVTECSDKYIFQTYLKAEMKITNENKF